MILGFLRRLNYRPWVILILLIASISGAFIGYNDAVRRLEGLPWVGILLVGLLAGWAAERARARTLWALLLFLFLSLTFTFVYYGRLLEPLLALERAWINSVLRFGQAWLQWASTGFLTRASIGEQLRSLLPSPEPLVLSLREISTSINVVLFHFNRWLESAHLGETANDLIGLGIVWSVLFCIGSAWAVFGTLRFQNPLLGLAPLLLGQAFALNYVNARPFSLLAVIFSSLMACAFTRHFAEENRWIRERKDYADYLTQDTGFTSLFLTAFIVLMAFFASLPPLITIEDIENFFNRFRRGETGQEVPAARSLGLEPLPEAKSNFAAWKEGGLPRQHLLGSGPELSERVVMNIQIEEELQSNAPSRTYYWRALTYDQYTGHGWSTSETKDRLYASRELVLTAAPYRSLEITARVNAVQDLHGLMYAPGEVVSADRPFELSVRPVPEPPETIAGRQTIFPPDIFASRINAQRYRVSALLPLFNTKTLESALPDYPAWIRERYLALPSNLSDRLLKLVLELTDEQPTPYLKAQAIEAYLRTIPYSLDIPAPDPFTDVVDYFLFDLRKGYCDYYATAMVVMARVAGIPARLAVGYASGTYDPVNRRFVVTEADAHSWVEIYFPNIGWVEFEPTASLPPIQRPEAQALETAGTLIPSPPSPPEPPSFTEIVSWGIIAFIVIGGLTLFWNTLENFRMRRLGAVKGLTLIFKQLYRHSRPFSGRISPDVTPLEFSEKLQAHLQREFGIPGWKNSLPYTLRSLNHLTSLYVQAIYSPHPLGYTDLKLAWQYWRYLRRQIWLARIGKSISGKKAVK